MVGLRELVFRGTVMFCRAPLAFLFVLLLLPFQSIAAPVTVTVSGETSLFFSGPFAVGTSVTATWTYDTDQPPDVSASQSLFYNAADSFSLSFDGYGTYTGENGRIGQNEVLGTENHSMYIGNGNGTVSGPVIAGLEILYFSVRFAGNTYDDQDVLTSGFGFDDAVFQETLMRFQPVGGGSQTQVELDFRTRVFEFQATGIPIPGTLFLLSFSLVFFGAAARRRVGCQSSAG